MFHKHKALCVLPAIILFCLAASYSHANDNGKDGDKYWIGPNNGLWSNPIYWFLPGVPGADDEAYIDNGSTCRFNKTYAIDYWIHSLIVDDNSELSWYTFPAVWYGLNVQTYATIGEHNTGTIRLRDRSFLGIGDDLYIGKNSGSTGEVIMEADGIDSSDLWILDGNEYIGYSGTGSLIQNGGKHKIGKTLYLGRYSNGTGTYTISGSSSGLLEAQKVYVGYNSTGTLNIENPLFTINIDDELRFGAKGELNAVPGSHVYLIDAYFKNYAASELNLSGLENLELIFHDSDGLASELEISGKDMYTDCNGLSDNFALGGLTVGGGGSDPVELILKEDINNANRGGPHGYDEALYVRTLRIADDSTLNLNNYHLYYRVWDRSKGWNGIIKGGDPLPIKDYDISHVKIDIEVKPPKIPPTPGTFDGIVTINAESLRLDGLDEIILYLEPNYGPMGVLRQMNVHYVSGDAISYDHVGDVIIIKLDKPYYSHGGSIPNDSFSVDVAYGGIPKSSYGPYILPSVVWWPLSGALDPVISTWSSPWRARDWWACKDVLDDKFTADIYVTVPGEFYVGSNGWLEGVYPAPNNKKIYHWCEDHEISTHMISLVIAKYEELYISNHGSLDLYYYLLPDQLVWKKQICDSVNGMLDLFTSPDRFGDYPFMDEKYGMAEAVIPWGKGRIFLEHQTMPTMAPLVYYDIIHGWQEVKEHTVAHELAHQWWGNYVSCETWSDIWLSEGFASFSEALWYEGKNNMSAYHDHMNSDLWPKNPDHKLYVSEYSTNESFFDTIFNPNIYDKGAWVLHMLRHILDDEVFFKALADYKQSYKEDSATTVEFKNSVIQTCIGLKPSIVNFIDTFIEEWVMKPGSPDYHYNWENKLQSGKNILRVAIWQKQEERDFDLMTMPLDLRVKIKGTLPDDAGHNDKKIPSNIKGQLFTSPPQKEKLIPLESWNTFTVWNSEKETVYEFELSGPAVKVELDPDNWVLCHSKKKVNDPIP